MSINREDCYYKLCVCPFGVIGGVVVDDAQSMSYPSCLLHDCHYYQHHDLIKPWTHSRSIQAFRLVHQPQLGPYI